MLVLAVWSCGQETAPAQPVRETLPEAPADGLLDEGNIFNAEERVLMVAELEVFRRRTDLPARVVTVNYVFGETVGQYGERLVTAWSGNKGGVVLLYERGSGQLNYSATPATLGPTENTQALFLSASRAAASLPEEATAAQRLRAAMHSLTLSAAALKKTDPSSPGSPAPVTPGSPADVAIAALPAPPVDFVIDEAEVFDLTEEAALKTELVTFHSKYGMDIYVATYPVLSDTPPQLLAERLARKWLPARCGAVLVMSRADGPDEQPHGIAGSALNEQRLRSSVLNDAIEEAKLKAREAATAPGGSPAKGLRAAADHLMRTFAVRSAPPDTRTESSGPWRIITGLSAAFVFGSALLFLFHRFQERLERRTVEPLFFPDVTVGCRLGAPHGGGQVAGISFDKNPGP